MTLLLLVAAVAFVWRLWARVQTLESTIVNLTDRVNTLERGDALEARRTPVTTPASVVTAPPKPPPVPHAAPVQARPPAPPPILSKPVPPLPPYVPTGSKTPVLPEKLHDESLETRIGSRWLLYVGVIAIIVGVSYFEKLAIENRWIGETARVIQGAIAGLALVGIGLRFVRAGYRVYGRVLSGCGIAVLYVSTYAAFNSYHLVSRPVAFALMSLVTAMAAVLADRQRSQSMAIVAVGGGFATPFLLPTAIDAHVALFTYEAILIAGTMFLAHRREWPALNLVSYAFTVLTVADWAEHFYTSSKYLSIELFLTAFCAMYLYILRESRHSTHPIAEAERAILWTAPFGYYFASIEILGDHTPALLTYLVVLSLVGVLASSRAAGWIRLVFWAASVAPLLMWSAVHVGWMGLAAWTAIYLIYLAGLLETTLKDDGKFGGAEIALVHLNGLAASRPCISSRWRSRF